MGGRGLSMLAVAAMVLGAGASCGTTVSQQRLRGSAGQAATSGGDNGLQALPSATDAPGPRGTAAQPQTGPLSSIASPAAGTGVLPTTAAAAGPAVLTPIQLGFLDTETGNAAAFGLNAGTTFTSANAAQALVAAFNKTGGIAGRRITAVIAKTDTASNNWETDYSAACAKFTQDNKVAAVLGYSFAYLDSFESCLTKAGVAHLDDGYNVGDAQSFRQYPLHFGLANPTWDRHYLAQLEGPLATGYVTKASRLGVLLSDCAYDQRAWKAQGLPFIRSHGLNVVDTETLTCVNGANGDSAAVAQISGSILKFRSAGVDRVVAEGVPVVLFGSAAETQGWRPGYVVTSWTGGAVIQGSGLMPTAQEANVHGYGWLPIADVSAARQPPLNASQQRCLALYRGQGLVPRQYNDFLTAYTFCDAMFLYEAALRATAGRSDGTSIANAIEQLGTAYASTTTLGGETTFGPGRHDGPTIARPWAWDAACSCFTYQGAAQPIS